MTNLQEKLTGSLTERVADALRQYSARQGVVRTWDEYAAVTLPIILAEAARVARNQFQTGDLHAAGCTIANAIRLLGDRQ